jgi:hypothetical protein
MMSNPTLADRTSDRTKHHSADKDLVVVALDQFVACAQTQTWEHFVAAFSCEIAEPKRNTLRPAMQVRRSKGSLDRSLPMSDAILALGVELIRRSPRCA